MLVKPRLITMPREDWEFAEAVESAVTRLNGETTTRQIVVALLGQLLPDYPHIEIHQQHTLASYETDPAIWYVYRDRSAASTEN